MAETRESNQSTFFFNRWMRRLYDWVVDWAQTRYANTALFVIAFLESSFFPIPPDVLMIAMGVGAPKKSLWFAAVSTVGSVLGGIAGYAIGFAIWGIVGHLFFAYVPGFTPELFSKVTALYQENTFWAVFTAGFTPIPYKIFTISAGVAQVQILPFIAASIFSRGLRFFLVGAALYFFGPSVQRVIEKYFNWLTIVFTVLLVLGVALLKGIV